MKTLIQLPLLLGLVALLLSGCEKEESESKLTPLQQKLAERRAIAEKRRAGAADPETKRLVKVFIEGRSKLHDLRERLRKLRYSDPPPGDLSEPAAAIAGMAGELKKLRLKLEARGGALVALATEADDVTSRIEVLLDDHAAHVANGVGARTATEFAQRSDELIAAGEKQIKRLHEITASVVKELRSE